MNSDPGSFARRTFEVRIPAILKEALDLNPTFDEEIRRNIAALHDELTAGAIRGLIEDAPDRPFWDAAAAPYVGQGWLEAPWYWAEAYFYRRVLEATGYFQPGPWQGVDPYAAKKAAEWVPDAAPRVVAQLLESLPDDDLETQCERLLHADLWGNRTDLSYMVAAHLGTTTAPSDERSNLLVDDSAALWRFLQTNAGERVAILADNAGTELLMDVVLLDFLLTTGLAAEVHLHLKPQPMFVSDAMIQDLADGLDALALAGGAAAKLARRVEGHIVAGELILKTHWFNASSLFYSQMPEDLRADLARMDLVLVKGDANYRRLLDDAHWPPTTAFADGVEYFPAPVAALRTLKGEIIVGLAPGQAERLAEEDPAWLVNGPRGVIQARL
jgi:uncharacterized protein with ATP-grasp and redox domains